MLSQVFASYGQIGGVSDSPVASFLLADLVGDVTLNDRIDALLSGSESYGPDMAGKNFIYSVESFDRLVQGTYAVLLQRQTDVDGLNSWIDQLQADVPFATIGEQIVTSDEFFDNAVTNK